MRKKKYFYIMLGLYTVLSIYQIKTTQRVNLLQKSNDQISYQHEKIVSYAPVNKVYSKISLWNRSGRWIESRQEFLVLTRLENGFFENIDLNNYFFASHPRERVGYVESEKFLYIFIPFCFYGLYLLTKNNKLLLASTTLPFLFLLSFIGNYNPLGPIILLPSIAVAIAMGLAPIIKNKKWSYAALIIVLTILVTIQVLGYENYI